MTEIRFTAKATELQSSDSIKEEDEPKSKTGSQTRELLKKTVRCKKDLGHYLQ